MREKRPVFDHSKEEEPFRNLDAFTDQLKNSLDRLRKEKIRFTVQMNVVLKHTQKMEKALALIEEARNILQE